MSTSRVGGNTQKGHVNHHKGEEERETKGTLTVSEVTGGVTHKLLSLSVLYTAVTYCTVDCQRTILPSQQSIRYVI